MAQKMETVERMENIIFNSLFIAHVELKRAHCRA